MSRILRVRFIFPCLNNLLSHGNVLIPPFNFSSPFQSVMVDFSFALDSLVRHLERSPIFRKLS